ncbi:transposase [Streptomyces decoyicus]
MIEPFLPIGRFGPHPELLRPQFENVIWRFRTGSLWWDMPPEHGAWQTVHHRFIQWRYAAVFERLADDDRLRWHGGGRWTYRWSAWTPPARAHHYPVGMVVCEEVLGALEEAVADEEGLVQGRRTQAAAADGGSTPAGGTSGDGRGTGAGPG